MTFSKKTCSIVIFGFIAVWASGWLFTRNRLPEINHELDYPTATKLRSQLPILKILCLGLDPRYCAASARLETFDIHVDHQRKRVGVVLSQTNAIELCQARLSIAELTRLKVPESKYNKQLAEFRNCEQKIDEAAEALFPAAMGQKALSTAPAHARERLERFAPLHIVLDRLKDREKANRLVKKNADKRVTVTVKPSRQTELGPMQVIPSVTWPLGGKESIDVIIDDARCTDVPWNVTINESSAAEGIGQSPIIAVTGVGRKRLSDGRLRVTFEVTPVTMGGSRECEIQVRGRVTGPSGYIPVNKCNVLRISVVPPAFQQPASFAEIIAEPTWSIYGHRITCRISKDNRWMVTGHAASHVCKTVSAAMYTLAIEGCTDGADAFLGAGIGEVVQTRGVERLDLLKKEISTIAPKLRSLGNDSLIQGCILALTEAPVDTNTLIRSSGFVAYLKRLESDAPGRGKSLEIFTKHDLDSIKKVMNDHELIQENRRWALRKDVELFLPQKRQIRARLLRLLEEYSRLRACLGQVCGDILRQQQNTGLVSLEGQPRMNKGQVLKAITHSLPIPSKGVALRQIKDMAGKGVMLLPVCDTTGRALRISFTESELLGANSKQAEDMILEAGVNAMVNEIRQAERRQAKHRDECSETLRELAKASKKVSFKDFLSERMKLSITGTDREGWNTGSPQNKDWDMRQLALNRSGQAFLYDLAALQFGRWAKYLEKQRSNPVLRRINRQVLVDSLLRGWELAFADDAAGSAFQKWMDRQRPAAWAAIARVAAARGFDVLGLVSETTVFKIEEVPAKNVFGKKKICILPHQVVDTSEARVVAAGGLVRFVHPWENRDRCLVTLQSRDLQDEKVWGTARSRFHRVPKDGCSTLAKGLVKQAFERLGNEKNLSTLKWKTQKDLRMALAIAPRETARVIAEKLVMGWPSSIANEKELRDARTILKIATELAQACGELRQRKGRISKAIKRLTAAKTQAFPMNSQWSQQIGRTIETANRLDAGGTRLGRILLVQDIEEIIEKTMRAGVNEIRNMKGKTTREKQKILLGLYEKSGQYANFWRSALSVPWGTKDIGARKLALALGLSKDSLDFTKLARNDMRNILILAMAYGEPQGEYIFGRRFADETRRLPRSIDAVTVGVDYSRLKRVVPTPPKRMVWNQTGNQKKLPAGQSWALEDGNGMQTLHLRCGRDVRSLSFSSNAEVQVKEAEQSCWRAEALQDLGMHPVHRCSFDGASKSLVIAHDGMVQLVNAKRAKMSTYNLPKGMTLDALQKQTHNAPCSELVSLYDSIQGGIISKDAVKGRKWGNATILQAFSSYTDVVAFLVKDPDGSQRIIKIRADTAKARSETKAAIMAAEKFADEGLNVARPLDVLLGKKMLRIPGKAVICAETVAPGKTLDTLRTEGKLTSEASSSWQKLAFDLFDKGDDLPTAKAHIKTTAEMCKKLLERNEKGRGYAQALRPFASTTDSRQLSAADEFHSAFSDVIQALFPGDTRLSETGYVHDAIMRNYLSDGLDKVTAIDFAGDYQGQLGNVLSVIIKEYRSAKPQSYEQFKTTVERLLADYERQTERSLNLDTRKQILACMILTPYKHSSADSSLLLKELRKICGVKTDGELPSRLADSLLAKAIKKQISAYREKYRGDLRQMANTLRFLLELGSDPQATEKIKSLLIILETLDPGNIRVSVPVRFQKEVAA